MSEERHARLRPPAAVRWVARTLEKEGWDTWAVGGAVRDALAGRPPGDWDLATRAPPGSVRRIFRRTVPIGIEHGTVGVLARDGTMYEVTTFRRDVETSGRHAVVEFADRIEEDLSRRDFTINAVAWHPLREELLDPYGGAEDLRRGVLRTVGEPAERFREDYLRILRALRFAGEFGLAIDGATWRALSESVERLRALSPERVREELWKVLETAERPSRALALYATSGAARVVHPEIDATVGRRDPSSGEPDVWAVSVLTADLLSRRRPHLRLAALLHGCGLAERDAPDEGQEAIEDEHREDSADEHREESVDEHREDSGNEHRDDRAARTHRRAAALMTRLRFSNREVARVSELASGGLGPPDPRAGDAELRRWLARVGADTLHDRARLWLAHARLATRRGDPSRARRAVETWRRLRALLAVEPPLSVRELSVDGRDLIRMGLQPGPRFGRILEALLDRVLEDPDVDQERALREIVAGGVPAADRTASEEGSGGG